MSLYIWFGLMLFASMVWLVWFVYRPLSAGALNLKKSNIALGKQKKQELEQDLNSDLIDETEFTQANAEIAQTLAIELDQEVSVVEAKSQTSSIWVILAITIFLSVMSVVFYQYITYKPAKVQQVSQQDAQPVSLEQSVEQLKDYLVNNPGDAKSWQTLGLALFELQDIEGSMDAYERAYQLNATNVSLLVEYASAIATAQNNQFTGRASTLVREALEIDPNAPDALYLAGLVAINALELDLAKQLWQRALSLLPAEHPDRQILQDILSELALMQNQPLEQHQVSIHVELSKEFQQDRYKNHYLMVYIKSATGRPMPIAIQKIRLNDFSGSVILTDADSVMPSQKLSESNEVLAVVRLSQTGSAMKQADDVEVLSQVINVKNNPVVNLRVE